jgi:hypothetical protein
MILRMEAAKKPGDHALCGAAFRITSQRKEEKHLE